MGDIFDEIAAKTVSANVLSGGDIFDQIAAKVVANAPSIEKLTGEEPGSLREAGKLSIGGLSKIIPFIGDEAVAGGAALLDTLFDGDSFNNAYNQRVAEVKNYQKAFNMAANEVGPGVETATDLANALSIPVPTKVFSAASGIRPVAGNLAKGTALGTGFGGLFGFGAGEGLEDRLEKAKSGAKVGAAFGAGATAIGEGFRVLGNKLSSMADDLGSQILGYNTKNPGNKIGYLDAKGNFTKKASEGVSQVSKKDMARSNLQGFLDDLKVTDSPEKAALKLSQFKEFNGQTIGSVVDDLANEEAKLLSKGVLPQEIVTVTGSRPDLPARAFRTKGVPELEGIQKAAPNFTEAQNFIDEISQADRSAGQTMSGILNSIKTKWEKSGQTLADLKNIQEKFGLVKKATFQGNKIQGPSAIDLLNNKIYGALAESLGERVSAIAAAAKKPELYNIFKLANKNYGAASTFENLAFKASRKFGVSEGVKSVFGLTSKGLGLTGAELGVGAVAPGLIPLIAAERGLTFLGKAAPIQTMKGAKAISPYAKALGSLFETRPGPLSDWLMGELNKKPQKKKIIASNSLMDESKTESETELPANVSYEQQALDLQKAVISQESGGNTKAVSSVGAKGLMQIMPATAKEIANELGVEDYDLHDAETNKQFGTHYLAKLLKMFDGDPELALTAYHSGPGRVQKLLKITKGSTLEDVLQVPFKDGGLGPVGRKYAKQVLARLIDDSVLEA